LEFSMPTSGSTATFDRQIVGVGRILKSGQGKLILTSNQDNFSGTVTVNDGTLQFGNGASDGVINRPVTVNSPGILRFEPRTATTFNNVISGNGKVEYNGSSNKTLTLTAQNTYTGTTTIETEGRLFIGTYAFGIPSLESHGRIAGNIINNGDLYFNVWSNNTYSGVISGTGTVKIVQPVSYTQTFNGANTCSSVNILNGRLALGASGSIENAAVDISSNSTLDISAGNKKISSLDGESSSSIILGARTLTIGTAGQNDGGGNFAGIFSGTGGVTKQGTGVFILDNANNSASGLFNHLTCIIHSISPKKCFAWLSWYFFGFLSQI